MDIPPGRKGVRARLQQAALALFLEQGYDQTTAAGIAARAGVTERTFFRHFPDKREVLFDGQEILLGHFTRGIDAAPAGATPLEVLLHAFGTVVELIEGNRPYAEPRQRVIEATPALHERELAKVAVLTRALAQALMTRGVPASLAALAATVGMGAFVHAVEGWFAAPGPGFGHHLERAFDTLHELIR